MAVTLAVNWAQARDFALWAILGGALTLCGMLGAGGAAALVRARVADIERRRGVGAALGLWLAACAALLSLSAWLLPARLNAMSAGCFLALFRLALALKFDLRPARPRGADFAFLLRAGFRPLIASVAFVAAALLGGTLAGALLDAALLLGANAAMERGETEKKRAAGRLTALAVLMAAVLAFLPGRVNALAGLAIAWLTAVSLAAGPSALLHLTGALYEAYLPLRAWRIRRRAAR